MQTNVDWMKAQLWYKDELEKSLKHWNPHNYHICCHVYTTRGAKEIAKTHKQTESFSKHFSFTSDPNKRYEQVNKFYQCYCEMYGDFPWKNRPHVKKNSDSTDEDQPKPVKKEEMNASGDEKPSEDSCEQQDWPLEDPKKQRLLDFREYKENLLDFKLSQLRVDLVKATAESKRVAEENERLTAELSLVKIKMAEQEKALEAVTSKLDWMVKGPLAGLLGKRTTSADLEKDELVSGSGPSIRKSSKRVSRVKRAPNLYN
jgi:hypothetical protein